MSSRVRALAALLVGAGTGTAIWIVAGLFGPSQTKVYSDTANATFGMVTVTTRASWGSPAGLAAGAVVALGIWLLLSGAAGRSSEGPVLLVDAADE